MEAPIRNLIFTRTQRIEQQPGETAEHLHERLRERATNSIVTVKQPARIVTPSWYTLDASAVLNIDNAVAVCTSTCKHELPFQLFVGTRKEGWIKVLSKDPDKFSYVLYPLGRDLTVEEKNAIYDRMPY